MSSEKAKSPDSQVLYFFLSVLLMGVIGFVQYLSRYVLKFLFPLKSEDFVDLCSITNTSVFIFDQDLHGYYIHGESPAGAADISATQLKQNLDNEASSESKIRGLLSELPNL